MQRRAARHYDAQMTSRQVLAVTHVSQTGQGNKARETANETAWGEVSAEFTRVVLQMMQTRTPPASTGRCCSRKRGDMTRPVVLINRDIKKCLMLVSWFKQCSCWSVEDSITPATKAPSSEDKPCKQKGPKHGLYGS